MNTIQHLLDHNDIIYKTPPIDWWQGWLIGNGSGAATLWNPVDKFQFQLGHTDTIDLTPNIPQEGGIVPNMRHVIRGFIYPDGLPLFDSMYLKDYTSRTSLSTGIVSLDATSQFGTFNLQSFYTHTPDVFVLKYSDILTCSTSHTLNLERLGSRMLPRIWTGVTTDSSYAMGKTTITQVDDILLFQHTKDQFHLAIAVHIQDNNLGEDHISDFFLSRKYPISQEFSIELRIAAGLGDTLEVCTQQALQNLKQSLADDFDTLKAKKIQTSLAEWPDFYISLPKDPYWENLWYSSRYHLRTCYKGHYPAFFINGPFSGSRDKREWSECWLNWNMHDSHLCIPQTGDWDLFEAYTQWRMRQIEPGKQLAKNNFGADGFVTEDQQRPNGGNRGLVGDYYKLQIVSNLQTSIHLYTYWKYTKESVFLNDYLYPYLEGTLTFWKSYLVKELDGHYHIPRSNPYEFHGGYSFKDCLTDLAHVKKCLQIFKEIYPLAHTPNEILADWCIDAYENLVPFTEVALPKDYVTCLDEDGNRIYDNPFFYGQNYTDSDRVYAMGLSEHTNTYVSHSHTHADRLTNPGSYGVFCSSQSAFIYPCRLIDSNAHPKWRDLMDQSTDSITAWENGRNALRTIRRYPRQLKEFPEFGDSTLDWTGHSLEMPAIAVLGLPDELRKAMNYFINTYQMFPQGLFNYHPRVKWLYGYSHPHADTGERLRVDHNPYSMHFAFEPTNIFTETLTLALLDSSNSLIKLFQAYDEDGTFHLPALDGFSVTATQENKTLTFIEITSHLGEMCNVRIEWQKAYIKCGDTVTEHTPVNGILSFETYPHTTYTLLPLNSFDSVLSPQLGHPAPEPREFHAATIGLFKRF